MKILQTAYRNDKEDKFKIFEIKLFKAKSICNSYLIRVDFELESRSFVEYCRMLQRVYYRSI